MYLFVLLYTKKDIWKNVLIKQISIPISMYFFLLWKSMGIEICLEVLKVLYHCLQKVVSDRPKSLLLYCIFSLAKYLVVITVFSGVKAFLRCVGDVSMSLIRSVTNMIPARSHL